MSHGMRAGLALAVVATMVLTTTGTAQAAAATIRGRGTTWDPTRVSIHPGQSVKWRATNGDHTIRAYGGNWSFSRTLNEGTSVTRTFNRTGRFKFFCTIHGNVSGGDCTGMCGRVRVT